MNNLMDSLPILVPICAAVALIFAFALANWITELTG